MPAAVSLRTLNYCLPRLALRLVVVGFVLIVLLFCGLRVYTVYSTHRAVLLLDEATRIQIGATENSILPLVTSYSGVKQAPPPPERTDDCPSKADCEFWNAHLPDYSYEVDLSPFNVFSAMHQSPKGFHLAIAYLMFRTPIFLRNLLSLRDWYAFARINIRAGRVENVSSGLYVEGRRCWLAHSWHLLAGMPQSDMPQTTYHAEAGWLELNTSGQMTDQTITSVATGEQFQAARSINTRCLTELIPCNSLSDLSPRAFEYERLHPEADSNLK